MSYLFKLFWPVRSIIEDSNGAYAIRQSSADSLKVSSASPVIRVHTGIAVMFMKLALFAYSIYYWSAK